MDLYEGYYVIKFAARSTPQAKCTFKVKTSSETFEPMSMKGQGDTGYGIETSGECNYHSTGTYSNDGKGGGWEWIMIPFRVLERDTRTVTFTYSVEAEGEGASASISDISVLASDIRIAASIRYDMHGTTLSSDQNLDFSDVRTTYFDAEPLKAYIVKEINGSHAVLEQVTGAVPASTGLFLLGTSEATYKIKVVENAAPLTSPNYLEPVLEEEFYTEQNNPNTYVYGVPLVVDKVEGFYKVKAITVPAGKAVLRIPDSQSGARPAIFTFDTPTGVTEVEAEADTHNEPIYNLCGQRVSKPKGLVIKGGKAYLVR